MVDSENSSDNYKTLKISIEAIIKNPEMLNFIPSFFKIKNMCKSAVKTLLLIIMYIPDQ